MSDSHTQFMLELPSGAEEAASPNARAHYFRSVPSSSVSTIDALAENSWSAAVGQSHHFTYSFSSPVVNASAFNATQQQNTILALNAWAKVANVTFSQVVGQADITFGSGNLESIGSNLAGITFYSFNFSNRLSASNVIIDDGVQDNLAQGSAGFNAIVHEIGHALGLKHPFEGTPVLSAELDNSYYTVMSYTHNASPNLTPMIGDIAAIQYIYGANTATNAGDSVYQFPYVQSTIGYGAATLWDASGTDTIIGPSVVPYATIDLRSGQNYFTTNGLLKVWIAEGAVIENAVGNTDADTINGNSSANRIFAGLGNDTVLGNEGNDTICGGTSFADAQDASDVVYGNAGNDIIYGNAGADTIYGGSGSNDGAEVGNDILYGGLGADIIYGNGGNDTLVGASSNDSLYGGAGDDRFVMNSLGGVDMVFGFQGAGVAGGDVLKIDSGINGQAIYTAADVIARATADGDNTLVDLGNGNGVILTNTHGLLDVGDVLVL